MTPRPGDRVTLRYPRPGRISQHVTGVVIALFDDEQIGKVSTVFVPSVRIRADDPALGGPEDVWEAPLVDVASCRRAL